MPTLHGRHASREVEPMKAEDSLRLVQPAGTSFRDPTADRYRMALEGSGEPIAICCDGKIDFLNTAATTLLNVSGRNELSKRPLSELATHDYRQIVERYLTDAQQAGRCLPAVQVRLRRCGGDEFIAELRASALQLDGLSVAQVSILDVTERTRALLALRSEHRALTSVVSALPGMIYRCRDDTSRSMEFVSAGCIRVTGFRAQDLTGPERIPFAELIFPDDRQRVLEAIEHAGAGPLVLRYRLVTAEGTVREVCEHAQCVELPDGTRSVTGIIQEIPRAFAVATAAEARQAGLELALDGANVGWWDWNAVTGRVYLDRTASRILRLADDELDATVERCKSHVHPDDAARLFDAAELDAVSQTQLWHSELRVLQPRGNATWSNMVGRVLLRNSAGTALRAVGTLQPALERKDMSQRLALFAQYD